MSAQWQSGVFGCFDNCGLCVITFLVPCYTFGKNAEAMGESCTLCGLLMCCVPQVAYGAQMVLRTKLREQRGIEGTLTSDLLYGAFCTLCTIVQEAQEIRAMQGGHMAVENMERA